MVRLVCVLSVVVCVTSPSYPVPQINRPDSTGKPDTTDAAQHRADPANPQRPACVPRQIMEGTSDPLVGYAYRSCLRSVAGTPERIARANKLMTSSACGPSRGAPTIRSASLSTIT